MRSRRLPRHVRTAAVQHSRLAEQRRRRRRRLLEGRRRRQTAELYRWLNQLEGLVDPARTSHGWTPAGDLTTTQREQLDAAAGQTVELLAPIPVIFEQERPVP